MADQRVSARCARPIKPQQPESEIDSQPSVITGLETIDAARLVKEICRSDAAPDNLYHAAKLGRRDGIHSYPQSISES